MNASLLRRRALIALGANLPFGTLSGAALLAAALDALETRGWKVAAASSVWESTPWPPSDQPLYVNGCAALEIGVTAPQALADLLDVERAFGRTRGTRNAARTLDLDLLAVDNEWRDEPGLTLPHPRLAERSFVLAPLAEIAPDWRHPDTGLTAGDMLAALPVDSALRRIGSLRE